MHAGVHRGAVIALAVLVVVACSGPSPSGPGGPGGPGGASGPPAGGPALGLPDPGAVLVAQAVSYPDVFAAPIPPDIAVYADGSVYTPGERTRGAGRARYVVRRLTPAGLKALHSEFDRVVGAGGEIGTERDTGAAAGIATYTVSSLRDGAMSTARTTSTREGPDAVALQAFAERWQEPGWPVPGITWEQPAPVPYEADRFALWIWVRDECCRDARLADAALAVVPVVGPVAQFGQAPNPRDPMTRCGTIDTAARRVLAAALAANGMEIGGADERTEIQFNLGDGVSEMAIVPLLPGTDGCTDLAG
jgi:hypothetical protein